MRSLVPLDCAIPVGCNWQNDESLFSIASRLHLISGNVRASDTCRQLFGHPRSGTNHDFPARVQVFVDRTEHRLGEPQQIVQQHTILPFFLTFVDRAGSANAMAASIKGASGNIKARLGMLASRVGASHPLKSCPECMVSDAQDYGTAHWHTTHQLPGAWICTKHKVRLTYATIKVSGVDRFGWCLPSKVQLLPCAIHSTSQEIDAKLEALALGAARYWTRPAVAQVLMEHVVWSYWHQLKVLGLSSENNRLRHQAFGAFMHHALEGLCDLPELRSIPRDPEKYASHFADMLTARRCPRHPLKHLLFQLALYGECGLERIFESPIAELVDVQKTELRQPDDDWLNLKSRCVAQLLNGGISPTAVARNNGISLTTVMHWGAQAGLIVKRRPKVLVTSLRLKIIKALKNGEDKEAVASRHNISVQTITTTLRTEPGLSVEWKRAVFSRRQHEARVGITEAALGIPGGGIKAIRQAQPACYAWLYRNDRAWLDSFANTLGTTPRIVQIRVQWDERDRALADAIQAAALALSEQQPHRRVTLAQICQALPDLKRLLSKLNRLPLCRDAIAWTTKRAKHTPQML